MIFYIALYLLIGSLLMLYPFLTDSIGGGYDGEGRCDVCGWVLLSIMWPWIVYCHIYAEYLNKPPKEQTK